jgi:hypothetical protein
MMQTIACLILTALFIVLGMICVVPLQQAIEYKNKFQGGLAIVVMIIHFIVAVVVFYRGIWGV